MIENLIIEGIQINGTDVYYLPRVSQSEQDLIYGEDTGSVFNTAYSMEAYMNSVMGYEGQSEFFTKFGLEIRDPMRITIARRTFQKYANSMERPKEGDLIYVPFMNNMFEIKFVEEEKDFHTLGRMAPNFFYYQLNIELFKFSNEKFNTGIEDIDKLGKDYSYTITLSMNTSGSGIYSTGEFVYQGPNVSTANCSAYVKSWDRTNKILEIVNIKGIFEDNVTVIGSSSNAQFRTTTHDRLDFNEVLDEMTDNQRIQTEANTIINFDINSPWGQT